MMGRYITQCNNILELRYNIHYVYKNNNDKSYSHDKLIAVILLIINIFYIAAMKILIKQISSIEN